MARNEAQTRTDLIDPRLHERGWTENQIHREQTAGRANMRGGRGGRIDYLLRVPVQPR